MNDTTPCPCGSGRTHADCCGPYLAGAARPPTAEALMRSRYCAYALGRMDYLRETWHPNTRHADFGDSQPVQWLGLQIRATEGGGPDDKTGKVEFVARYKIGGRAYRLHEISDFARVQGRWYYMLGEPGPTDSSRDG
jgi:SEC-C motif-containing protein